MISCDTNILFPAFDSTSSLHASARKFLTSLADRDDVCLCEQVLMELYCLLRNPSVCRNPLSAQDAVDLINRVRTNPFWRVVDVVAEPALMPWVWQQASQRSMACRRIFDLRLAATLRQHQVTEFATRNIKDFEGLGLAKVWNPLSETP